LVEHVVSQPKVRELFRNNNFKVDSLTEKLIGLIRASKEPDTQETYTRLLAHLAFCSQPMNDTTLTKLLLLIN
jgi:hypothetical protein